MRRSNEVLYILTPTDCVCDRLAAFIHWKDRSSLVQALAVAQRTRVDLQEIRRWCEGEGGSKQFNEFAARMMNP